MSDHRTTHDSQGTRELRGTDDSQNPVSTKPAGRSTALSVLALLLALSVTTGCRSSKRSKRPVVRRQNPTTVVHRPVHVTTAALPTSTAAFDEDEGSGYGGTYPHVAGGSGGGAAGSGSGGSSLGTGTSNPYYGSYEVEGGSSSWNSGGPSVPLRAGTVDGPRAQPSSAREYINRYGR